MPEQFPDEPTHREAPPEGLTTSQALQVVYGPNNHYTDEKTGLLLASGLDLIVDSAIGERERGESVEDIFVWMLDLDGFKGVNDAIGYDAADEVLRTVGKLIKRNIRLDDVFARVSRFGGDEFRGISQIKPGFDGTKQQTSEERFNHFIKRLQQTCDIQLPEELAKHLHPSQIAAIYKTTPLFGFAIGGAMWRPGMARRDLYVLAEDNMKEDKIRRVPLMSDAQRIAILGIAHRLKELGVTPRDLSKMITAAEQQQRDNNGS